MSQKLVKNKQSAPLQKASQPVHKDGLTITIKPAAPVHIELDLDALSFEDVKILQAMDENSDETQALAVISKVIGRDATLLPIRHLKPIIDTVMNAIGTGADQGN